MNGQCAQEVPLPGKLAVVLPRYLDFHKRKEVMSEMMLAVLEGRLALEDAHRRNREFLREVDHMFPTK